MHVTSRVVKNKTISRDRQTAGQKPHITAITWNLTLWSYTHEYIYIPSSSSTWIFVQAKAAHPPNLRTHCRNISLLCSLENWKFLYTNMTNRTTHNPLNCLYPTSTSCESCKSFFGELWIRNRPKVILHDEYVGSRYDEFGARVCVCAVYILCGQWPLRFPFGIGARK